MIKKLIPLIALPAVMIMGSCASRMETAGRADQQDDVYYSQAVAKEEVEVIRERRDRDESYVTEDEMYGDVQGDYAARIYRFRNYSPWRNYYSPIYTYYDPFMRNDFYYGPRAYVGINFGFNNWYDFGYSNYYGYNGYYGINPWRNYPFGYNSFNNFWGPYSYYNYFGRGTGYYGGGGYYADRGENYRSRPVRSGDNTRIDRGAFAGGSSTGAGAVVRDGNGSIISTRGRAESYRPQTSSGSGNAVPRTSTTRTSTPARPDRVSNAPDRSSQPSRVSTPPPSSQPRSSQPAPSSGGSSSGGRSNDGGGGARPSRGN